MAMIEAYFRIAGYVGGAFLLVFGVTGVIVGLLQIVLGRGLNLWPLQLAAGFITATLGISLTAWHMIQVYASAATMAQRAARLETIHAGYIDLFLMLKVVLAFMFFQVVMASFGKAVYMNSSRLGPMQVPVKGAAVPELKTGIRRVS
jgi:hypothetical protein